MGNNKEENILDTNNVCLESYNSICNLYNDETTRKIHFNRLLSFDEGVGSPIYEMCKDYVVEIEKDMKNNYRLR